MASFAPKGATAAPSPMAAAMLSGKVKARPARKVSRLAKVGKPPVGGAAMAPGSKAC